MSKPLRVLAAAVLVGMVASACVGTSGAEPAGATLDRAKQMESFLEDAGATSEEYARTHLGHYLQMRAKHLTKDGLEIPAGISFVLQTGHNGYCLKATDSELPSGDPWQTATVGFIEKTLGEAVEISDKDRCPKLRY